MKASSPIFPIKYDLLIFVGVVTMCGIVKCVMVVNIVSHV